jgi:hypothetical protein
MDGIIVFYVKSWKLSRQNIEVMKEYDRILSVSNQNSTAIIHDNARSNIDRINTIEIG